MERIAYEPRYRGAEQSWLVHKTSMVPTESYTVWGTRRKTARTITYITLECARLVDGEEEDDVLAVCESFGKNITILDLSCPESLYITDFQ